MRFEKVSFDEFCRSLEVYDKEFKPFLRETYDSIKLPKRSTEGSAGYDFFSPLVVDMKSGVYYTVPTGVRMVKEDGDSDVFLLCLPRSGLGFKSGFKLRNTAGVIDSDYYMSDNEGHIMARICVEEDTRIDAGKAFMQGIIIPYIKVSDDSADGKRNGGFGSTDKK